MARRHPEADTTPRYRRSPSLIFYWDDGRLVAHNYKTRRRMIVDPALVPFLHTFAPDAVPQRTKAALAEHTLLEPTRRGAATPSPATGAWDAWGALAAAFHFGTKDVAWSRDPRRGERRFARMAKHTPMPAATKRMPKGAVVHPLPAVDAAGDFPSTLLARRTWRQFGSRLLTLDELATLLRLTWGVQQWGNIPGQGRVALKTSPSGGACHPGEVYVLAVKVKGLEPGIYHYQPDRHRLVLVRKGARAADIGRYIPGQYWYRPASALFLMTAVVAREQWRYAFPRAYRALLVDAGHLCQTFCLVASWLQLAPFCSMALADSVIERDLGIDGESEIVLYAAGVGPRPPGGWRPGAPGFRVGSESVPSRL